MLEGARERCDRWQVICEETRTQTDVRTHEDTHTDIYREYLHVNKGGTNVRQYLVLLSTHTGTTVRVHEMPRHNMQCDNNGAMEVHL